MNIIGLILSYFYIGFLLFFVKYLPFSKEIRRNIVHIGVSNWFFIAYIFLDQPFLAMLVPLSFVIINFISYRRNSFLERERRDLGTVYYAFSCFLMTIFSYSVFEKPYMLGIGLLIMGYGDGLANVIGRRFPWRQYYICGNQKSIGGTLTIFLVSFFILFLFLGSILLAVLISLLVALLENITPYHMDNLTVPLSSFFLVSLFF